jgi:hypothetical protein
MKESGFDAFIGKLLDWLREQIQEYECDVVCVCSPQADQCNRIPVVLWVCGFSTHQSIVALVLWIRRGVKDE